MFLLCVNPLAHRGLDVESLFLQNRNVSVSLLEQLAKALVVFSMHVEIVLKVANGFLLRVKLAGLTLRDWF